MLNRPSFKSCFRVEVLGDAGVALLGERQQTVLSGRAFTRVGPLLDGRRSVDEIAAALAPEFSMPEVFYTLQLLERDGYIVEGNGLHAHAAFWHELGVDAAAGDRLGQRPVVVTTIGAVDRGPLEAAFMETGLRIAADGEIEVVLTDDYEQTGLAEVNARALASGRDWMLVKPEGAVIWIGPVFHPGEGPCWACLAQRLKANRQMEAYIQATRGSSDPIVPTLARFPAMASMAAHLVTLEVAKWLARGRPERLQNTLLTFDLLSLEQQVHAVVRRPQCSACGDPRLFDPGREAQPVRLQPARKKFRSDGGHRAYLPEETFEKYKHHVSPITGVVSSLQRLDYYEGSGLIYTYGAGHNFALMNRDLFFLLRNIRGRSGGKGMTDMQAKLSGLCEAVERYSGVFRGDEIRTRSSYRDLGARAIDPRSYLLFSDRQYERRREWNRAHDSDFHRVPEPFDERRAIDWSPVWSLTRHEPRYVPSAYCYYGHPDLQEYFDTASDANGNAAGNTLEEAVLQGFLELVERDAVALWWYNRLRKPEVDLASFPEPYVGALIDHYRTLHREIWALDITSDLGIPTIAAISRRTDRAVQDIVLGFGAHLDPKIALLRALTEINQFMPCVSADDDGGATKYWFDDSEAIRWWQTATLHNQPYLVPREGAPAQRREDFPDLSKDDLREDVETCVRIAAGRNLETFVLDQTRPDVSLNVVKVIVPGLRHFWKRFGPGRLYDIPAQMGWLERPVAEEDLNPIGVFF